MFWDVTVRVTDCAMHSPLQGAQITDGSTNATTDLNGQCILLINDQWSEYGFNIIALGYVSKYVNFSKKNHAGTIQSICLEKKSTIIVDPPPCFIVSVATGSAQSEEIIRLRQLRERVMSVSRLGAELIDAIYREYYQFSPEIAGELQQNAFGRHAVLWTVVRPLLAWYSLAGTLAFEFSDEEAVRRAKREVLVACPTYMVPSSIAAVLEAILSGEKVPAATNRLLIDFLPRMRAAARFRFASWAILDPLARVWRSVADRRNVVDEVAQWLGSAPLESLSLAFTSEQWEHEIKVLAGFFEFKPTARRQLGECLLSLWPERIDALKRHAFI